MPQISQSTPPAAPRLPAAALPQGMTTPPSCTAPLQDDLTRLKHLQQHEPRSGLIYGLRLRHTAKLSGDELRAAWACHYASACALRLTRLKVAQILNEEANTRFRALHHLEGLINTENVAGMVAQAQGEHGKAYMLFHDAMLSAEDRGLTRLFVIALNNLALSAQKMGSPEAALDWTLKSLDVSEAHGEEETQASTLTNAVTLTLQLGHLAQAERYAVRAQTLAQRLDLPLLYSVTLNNLSVVRSAQSRHAEALAAAEESLQIETRLGNRNGVLYAQVQRSRVLLDMGHADQALRDLRAVSLTAPPLSQVGAADIDIRIELLHLLGRAHMLRDEWAQGREHLEAAEQGARQFQRQHLLTQTLRERSLLEERAGNPDDALRLFKAYHSVERQVLDEQYHQRSQALMLTHEVREHRRLNAELTAVNTHLQYVAHHDPLTGSLNRTAFAAAAAQQLSQSQPHSLVVLDIDHFKRINDTYGHPIGDQVLKAVVSVIRSCVREHDLLCRWGGEEFILLLPRATAQQAAQLCARLRQSMREFAWPMPGFITASFGISVCQNDLEEMINQADQAVYQAKRGGRDQAVIFNEDENSAGTPPPPTPAL